MNYQICCSIKKNIGGLNNIQDIFIIQRCFFLVTKQKVSNLRFLQFLIKCVVVFRILCYFTTFDPQNTCSFFYFIADSSRSIASISHFSSMASSPRSGCDCILLYFLLMLRSFVLSSVFCSLSDNTILFTCLDCLGTIVDQWRDRFRCCTICIRCIRRRVLLRGLG